MAGYLALGVAALLAGRPGSSAAAGFTAYNDCSSSAGNPANTTEYRGNGTASGPLKDFDTGALLSVTVAVSYAACVFDGIGGPMPDSGTDAYNTFNGRVVFDDVVRYNTTNGGFWMEARFTGLNASNTYEFAASVNRGGSGGDYSNRFSNFTVSDFDSATQASTPGVTVNSATSVTFVTGINGVNGYVARWSNIQCGADGDFTARVQDGGGVGMGYAFDGIMLRENSPTTTTTSSTSSTSSTTTSTTSTTSSTATPPGILVGPSGSGMLTLDALPPATEWASRTLGNGTAAYATAGALDSAVSSLTATSITGTVVSDTGNPPGVNQQATWSSSGRYLQTRPAAIGATVLMGTLRNVSGAAINDLQVTYVFTVATSPTEEVPGHRVFCSLNGTNWTLIPALSGGTVSQTNDTTVTLPSAWADGSAMYLAWADDNGSAPTDSAYQIDNISFTPTTVTTTTSTTSTTTSTSTTASGVAQFVIVVSVDGMGSEYVKPLLTSGLTNELTTFKRFQSEGAGTLNARNDANYAVTLPNHVTMMTGRGVLDAAGHAWTGNGDPEPTETLESNKGSYVASGFDVAHDNGLRTGIWSGKSKFVLFQQSYSATTGAPDTTDPDDNGRDKIDYDHITSGNAAAELTADFTNQMAANPFNFVFFHYQEPDTTGHAFGWSTNPASAYATVLKDVDTAIGSILQMVENNPTLQGRTAIILTSDHGGHNYTHGDPNNYLDYTIPFYVWGAGVTAGVDLYDLNPSSRTAPGTLQNPPYTGIGQPVRNGDAGNLALNLLGLPPIPDSTINSNQDLAVSGVITTTTTSTTSTSSTSTTSTTSSTTTTALRIAALAVGSNGVALSATGLEIGKTVTVLRSASMIDAWWATGGQFVAETSATNWSEAIATNRAFYRLQQ